MKGYSQYFPGYYYTNAGEKIEGYIKNGPKYISFGLTKESKKRNIGGDEICCYVIGRDSFALVKNLGMNSFGNFRGEFAQVVMKGKLILYIQYYVQERYSGPVLMANGNMMPGGKVSHKVINYFIAGKDGTIYSVKRRNFSEVMTNLVSDNNALVQEIKSKRVKYSDLLELVGRYNRWAEVNR